MGVIIILRIADSDNDENENTDSDDDSKFYFNNYGFTTSQKAKIFGKEVISTSAKIILAGGTSSNIGAEILKIGNQGFWGFVAKTAPASFLGNTIVGIPVAAARALFVSTGKLTGVEILLGIGIETTGAVVGNTILQSFGVSSFSTKEIAAATALGSTIVNGGIAALTEVGKFAVRKCKQHSTTPTIIPKQGLKKGLCFV